MSGSPEADDAATALVAALGGLQGASTLYLRQAMEAYETEGAGGVLRIHIPRKTKDRGGRIQIEWLGLQPDTMKE